MSLNYSANYTKVVLSFGSNIGSSIFKKIYTIKAAVVLLSKLNVKPLKLSAFYKNPPLLPQNLSQKQINKISQMYFVNAVGFFKVDATPKQLLNLVKKVEAILGKKKLGHWLPRKIDIDIIIYKNYKYKQNTKSLTLPHASYKKRDFVIKPLKQIFYK